MALRDLTDVVGFLQACGRLAEVDGPVSVHHEAAALLHWASRRHRAVRIGRTDRGPLPVVGNVLCHDEVLAHGLGVPPEQAGRAFVERCTGRVRPRVGTDGPVLERSIEPAEIGAFLPVLTHYEGDSGAFLTTAVVSAVDPRTGTVARGVHRMEQRGPDRFGVALLNPPLSEGYAEAKATGRPALGTLRELIPSEAGAVLYAGINDTTLRFVSAFGPAARQVLGREIPVDAGAAGLCHLHGVGLIIRDTGVDERHDGAVDRATGYRTRRLLSAGIRDESGDSFGCIQLLNAPDAFRDWHLEAAQVVASELAAFIARRQ